MLFLINISSLQALYAWMSKDWFNILKSTVYYWGNVFKLANQSLSLLDKPLNSKQLSNHSDPLPSKVQTTCKMSMRTTSTKKSKIYFLLHHLNISIKNSTKLALWWNKSILSYHCLLDYVNFSSNKPIFYAWHVSAKHDILCQIQYFSLKAYQNLLCNLSTVLLVQ